MRNRLVVVSVTPGVKHRINMMTEDNVTYVGDHTLGTVIRPDKPRDVRRIMKNRVSELGAVKETGDPGVLNTNHFALTEVQVRVIIDAIRNKVEREEGHLVLDAAFSEAARRGKPKVVSNSDAQAVPAPEGVTVIDTPLPESASSEPDVAPTASASSTPLVLVTHGAEVDVQGLKIDLLQLADGRRAIKGKQLAELLGLAWAAQAQVLREGFEEGVVDAILPSAGGPQKTTLVISEYILPWLLNISPNKVRPEIRDNLKALRKELWKVINEYKFGSGVVVNPRVPDEEVRKAFDAYLAERAKKDSEYDSIRQKGLELMEEQYNHFAAMLPSLAKIPAMVAALQVAVQSINPSGPHVVVPQVGVIGTYSSKVLAKMYAVPFNVVKTFSLALKLVGDEAFGEPSAVVTPHHGHSSDNWRHFDVAKDALAPLFAQYRVEVANFITLRMGRHHERALEKVLATITPIGKGTWKALALPFTNNVRPIRPTTVT